MRDARNFAVRLAMSAAHWSPFLGILLITMVLADELVTLTRLTVAASILARGISVQPLMRWYARRAALSATTSAQRGGITLPR